MKDFQKKKERKQALTINCFTGYFLEKATRNNNRSNKYESCEIFKNQLIRCLNT